MKTIQSQEATLTTNGALVLQQVYEDGGDDAVMLAAQIGMPRRTAMNVLADLRRKGLMAIDQAYGDAWVRLTTRGASAAHLAGSTGDSILKSMRYILLLRGINVGGKNKVSMNDLKASLEGLGYQDVVTYINSGNVIFDTDDLTTIKENIAGMLGRFPFTIKHVILTKEEYLYEVSNLPEWWHQPLARKDVLFYTDDVDPENMKYRISQMPLHDEIVHFGKKAIFWGKYTEKEFLRTSYHKLLMKEKFYPLITIRNGRTFDRLGKMLG
jgi:hypothetical protein